MKNVSNDVLLKLWRYVFSMYPFHRDALKRMKREVERGTDVVRLPIQREAED